MKINREAYISSIKSQLDELNMSLAEIEAKIAHAKVDAHRQYAEEMIKLHRQSQQAHDQLDAIKAAGEDTWETMIANTEKVRDAFVNSFHFFKEQLKEK